MHGDMRHAQPGAQQQIVERCSQPLQPTPNMRPDRPCDLKIFQKRSGSLVCSLPGKTLLSPRKPITIAACVRWDVFVSPQVQSGSADLRRSSRRQMSRASRQPPPARAEDGLRRRQETCCANLLRHSHGRRHHRHSLLRHRQVAGGGATAEPSGGGSVQLRCRKPRPARARARSEEKLQKPRHHERFSGLPLMQKAIPSLKSQRTVAGMHCSVDFLRVKDGKIQELWA